MNESILSSIKKMLGIEDNYSPFDTDIIVLINAAFMTLQQLGIGPKEGFSIMDYRRTWNDFLTNEVMLNGTQQYVYLKVKMAFDPPGNSFVMEAMKQQCAELEWRLNVQAESVEKFDFIDDKKRKMPESNTDSEPEQTASADNSVVVQENPVPPTSAATSGSQPIEISMHVPLRPRFNIPQAEPTSTEEADEEMANEPINQPEEAAEVPYVQIAEDPVEVPVATTTVASTPADIGTLFAPSEDGDKNYEIHGENLQLFGGLGLF